MHLELALSQQTENQEFLQTQLITYIGNKRALLPFIGQGINTVKSALKKEKLLCVDVFSGSGIVSRFLKQHASFIAVNDLEKYSDIINSCYLTNKSSALEEKLRGIHLDLLSEINRRVTKLEVSRNSGDFVIPGFISELYAPKDINNIQKSDRCFYTPYNANYLDVARQEISRQVPAEYQNFFIAPLLSEASIHANTAGIFKGFYKNSKTGTGQFGGNGQNALSRITGKIQLLYPVFSNFECPFKVFRQNANDLVENPELYEALPDGASEYDVAYFDPPYNQHPYGSNYFMLNLLAEYNRPDEEKISRVSGIPRDWNRSAYNKKKQVAQVFQNLVKNVKAKFVLISFNSEGFITKDEMTELMSSCGTVTVLESDYNAFRGSRNLSERNIHVKEYLFLVDKRGRWGEA